MSGFDQQEFNEFILDHKVLGFFEKPITLKSGRQSCWYVNWRNVSEDAYSLDRLTDFVIAFTRRLLTRGELSQEPLCFYGVPEGASKLAIVTQFKWARQSAVYAPGSHPVPMGRGHPKEHGVPKDRYFVGVPRGLTIVLEDVTTTGGSLLMSIDALRDAQVPVLAAFGLTNRMERRDDGKSVAEAIQARESDGAALNYFHLSSALELLPQAVKRLNPSREIRQAIEEEFKNYGVEPLTLL